MKQQQQQNKISFYGFVVRTQNDNIPPHTSHHPFYMNVKSVREKFIFINQIYQGKQNFCLFLMPGAN